MSKKLPTRLASEPIVEVVSEVRFTAEGDAAVNLLPGILHAQLGPFDQQGRTFPVPFPAEMLAADPSLAFRPQVFMSKDNRIIQVGPRVASVALRAEVSEKPTSPHGAISRLPITPAGMPETSRDAPVFMSRR